MKAEDDFGSSPLQRRKRPTCGALAPSSGTGIEKAVKGGEDGDGTGNVEKLNEKNAVATAAAADVLSRRVGDCGGRQQDVVLRRLHTEKLGKGEEQADSREEEEEDDIIYRDLMAFDPKKGMQEGYGVLQLQVSQLRQEVALHKNLYEKAQEVIEQLKEENGQLRTTCERLEYNISSLFNTAKLEIERKEREIADLRRQLGMNVKDAKGNHQQKRGV